MKNLIPAGWLRETAAQILSSSEPSAEERELERELENIFLEFDRSSLRIEAHQREIDRLKQETRQTLDRIKANLAKL